MAEFERLPTSGEIVNLVNNDYRCSGVVIPLYELQIGESFCIPKGNGLSYTELKAFVREHCEDGFKYFLFEHGVLDVFEIARIPAGMNPNRFYKAPVVESQNNFNKTTRLDPVAVLMDATKQYVAVPFNKVKSYKVPELMHAKKVIPYSYFQRRLANVAVFKKSEEGAAITLSKALQHAVDTNKLEKIDQDEISHRFQTSSACYRLPGSN